jgi:hypothetical protein
VPRPPSNFIAGAVKASVMCSAQWHGEVIADLAAESPELGKAQVVRIGGRAGA